MFIIVSSQHQLFTVMFSNSVVRRGSSSSDKVDGLRWKNEDVEMDDYMIPTDYDLEEVCHRVTYGPGWVLLKKMFSEEDVAMARERILVEDKRSVSRFQDKDSSHNNYNGLRWGLLSRGKIFAKVRFHISWISTLFIFLRWQFILSYWRCLGSFSERIVDCQASQPTPWYLSSQVRTLTSTIPTIVISGLVLMDA